MSKTLQHTVRLALFVTLWLSEQPCSTASSFMLLPLAFSKHERNDDKNNSHPDQGSTRSNKNRNNNNNSGTSTSLRLAWWERSRDKVVAHAKKKTNDTQSLGNVTIVGIDNQQQQQQQRQSEKAKRRDKERQQDFEARKAAWEAKYGSAQALCRTFGGCCNSWWGDLDGEATRELYHTLLPRSLWALQEADILQPEELAPLAYQARVAAKEYARMRSRFPQRLLAMGFDGYRSWKRDGNPLNTKGLSWEDLWDKYEAQIVQEECASELQQGKMCLLDREALTRRIYLRILERSCATNQAFDRMFLSKNKPTFGIHSKNANNKDNELGDLSTIASQLDHDVREILLRPDERKKIVKSTKRAEKVRVKAERKAAEEKEKASEKASKLKLKEEKREQKKYERLEKLKRRQIIASTSEDGQNLQEEEQYDDATKQAQYKVLRIAANTRRKFRDV